MPDDNPKVATFKMSAAACRLTRDHDDSEVVLVLEALVGAGRRGVTQVSLGKALGMAPATVWRLIDTMESRDLVIRKSHPLDRRSKIIEITDAGRATIELQSGQAAIRRDRLLQDFTTEEVSALSSLLKRIVINSESVISPS